MITNLKSGISAVSLGDKEQEEKVISVMTARMMIGLAGSPTIHAFHIMLMCENHSNLLHN